MSSKRDGVRIALVNPPLIPGVMWHRLTIPIGLASLGAVVEKGGYSVKIVDCPALNMDHGKLKQEVASFAPDIIGITSLTSTFPSALQVAHVLRESCPEAFIVMGGPHATITSVDIINKNVDVDIVVRKEGEETLSELAGCVAEKKTFDKVAGITFRKDGETIQAPDRPFIQNLDELPYPAYHLLPLEKYKPTGSFFGKRVLPVMTSRGCPFHCSFCLLNTMFGKRFRARSPKCVVDELEWLKNKHGAKAFSFYDDTLTLGKERCYSIFEQMQERRIDLPWDCQTRSDQISREVLIKMEKAGCQFISFGIESGSQKMLNAMGKRITVGQNERAIRWAKEAGLLAAITVIIGYPGETAETLKETFDFIEKVKPNMVSLCVATPYPGTALYELVRSLGWRMSENWSRYDTVDFAFENPSLPNEYIKKMRDEFYDKSYSPSYILRHFYKNNLYSGILARNALSHYYWRIRSKI